MPIFFKNKKYLFAAAIILLIIGGYYWHDKSNFKNGEIHYKTAVAEKEKIITSVSGSGNVIVDSSANVDPTITGTVKNLSVSVGDKVTKGQFLFEIENEDLAPNVTKAHSSYLQSLASLETAKANKKEAKENYEDANSSEKSALKKKLEAAEISVMAAEENIKYASANYQNEKKNFSDKKVVSPIDGTVNAVNIKNGDDLSKLSSGSSREVPIIIGDLGTMKARVEVSEVDIASIEIGQKAILTFNAIDNFSTNGVVEKIDSLGAQNSGVVTYDVTLAFDFLDSRIRPEMNVSASIVTNSKENVIVVPSNAVKNENGKAFIGIMKNGAMEKREVETGLENNSKVEITKGVNQGELVITQTLSGNSKTSSANAKGLSSNRNSRVPGMIPGM